MGERKHGEPSLDNVFLAMSHPTRRHMLHLLQSRPACVTELADSFELSLNVVSKHLKYLERAGLLSRDRQGRTHMLTYRPQALAPATDWLSRHLRMWQGALNSFEEFIVTTNPVKTPSKKCPPPKKVLRSGK